MSILPKQPETFLKEFAWTANLLPGQVNASPFFLEWLFCSDLTVKDSPIRLSTKVPILLDTFYNGRIKLKDFSNDCPIIKYSISQYKLLKAELASIENEYNDPLRIIEFCFQVTNVYWDVVKEFLISNSFGKSYHEVYFFKFIKPAIKSESEFLSLAYHALLFKMALDKDERFWKREKHRKDRLRLEHQDFFNIYLNGGTVNDKVWFTRNRQEDYSSHDHIVSSWFAINRYVAFIETNIVNTNKSNN